MTSSKQITEIAVAASLASRERSQLDHDEIGILTSAAYAGLAHGRTQLVPAREIADAVRAKIDTRPARVDASRVDENVVAGLTTSLFNDENADSARDATLFAQSVENLNKESIYAHTSDAVDARVETWSEMRSASLVAIPQTHQVLGSTIVMEADLHIVEADGTEVLEPVLITIDNVDDPLGLPVIDVLERVRDALAAKALSKRLVNMTTSTIREISDVTVEKAARGWEDVDTVTVQPILSSYAEIGEGVSMLVIATFVYADDSCNECYLTIILPSADASLLTGRITA